MGVVGNPVRRHEDLPLVTGRGRFAADISFPHQLHMRVIRSPVAHGLLLGVDPSAALAAEGVVATWTAADTADVPPIDFRLTRVEGLEPYRQPILAVDRVRYVGEPVAALFAEDPYLAEDAAELVEIKIEELPVCLEAAGPLGEFGPGLTSEPAVVRKGFGDVDGAFAAADCIVELELIVGRHSGVPLETRGAIARYDAARDLIELYGAAKVPHWNRAAIASMLGRAPATVQLFEGHVGGGFGVRGELYPEDVLVCLAALRLGRPIKWIEDRREHLIATNHSRQQLHRIRAAVAGDGRLLAIDDTFFNDQGAYVRTHAVTVPDLAAAMLPGPYDLPAYRVSGHVRLTNKTPCGTYRAPGRYEGTFVREQLIGAIAARLGLDPIEVRKRNLIARERMPYTRELDALGTDVVLDSGDYPRLLERTLERVGWASLRRELADRRADGETVGAGVSLFVEKSGLGPFDGVRVTVDEAGTVEVVTGAASVGQGIETVIAQICADALGVACDDVRVTHGQTDRIAFGMGAFASRATVMTGSATQLAAAQVRAKAIDVASELLEVPPEMLVVAGGAVCRSDMRPGPSITLAEVARALLPGAPTLGERAPGLSAEGWYFSDHMTYPYGVHIAVVRVDRETGAVSVERYAVGYDVGRAINPMLVEGQIVGGTAQGLGGALLEEFVYDERGEPLAVTFADYLLPTAAEVPPVEVLITEDAPSPLNPLGVKGAGEGGVNGVGAAIAAAVEDAIGMPGAITRLPITPMRLKSILDATDRCQAGA